MHRLERIPEIDGLRAIAIILVLVWHCFNNLLQRSTQPLCKVFVLLTNQTWSGVDLFFVLSGFLITCILLNNRDSRNYFKAFYMRRIMRIFPIYYFVLFLFALLKTFGPDISLMHSDDIPFWSYWLHAQNIYMAVNDKFGAHFLGVSWSLAVEEQFYAILPLLIWLIPNRRWLPPIFLLLLASGAIFRYSYSGLGTIILLPARIDGLMFGSLLAYSYTYHFEWLQSIPRKGVVAVAFAITICTLALNLLHIPIPGGNVLPFSAVYGLVLLYGLSGDDDWIKRILRSRFLMRIGRVSYGIYLYHVIIMGYVFFLAGKPGPTIKTAADVFLVVVSLGVTFLVAELSFNFFERHMIEIGRKYKYDHTLSQAVA